MHFSHRPIFAGTAATAVFSKMSQMIRVRITRLALIGFVAAGVQLPAIGLAALPAPPAIYLDTTYVSPTGVTRPVSAGGDLQAVLNAAQPGDLIVLQAGATFTGNFTLPNKSGSGWIYVQSSAYSSLPAPGTRVTPSNASLMPKIVSPNSGSAIATANGAHHFRFVGIEVTATAYLYNLVLLSSSDGSQSNLPHDFVFDRCYLHGNATLGARRGIALNSASTAVIDSYLSDFKEVGADAQALWGWNGPGPFKIVNNYLEASGENAGFGGVDPAITNMVPSDIEIRDNYMFKPLKWKASDPSWDGSTWLVKNLFELKNAQRVLIDRNTFENNWTAGQNGFGILFTVRNQDGACPWCVVQDVTFTRNIIRNSQQGINILAVDNTWPSGSQRTTRVLIQNNVWYALGATSVLLQILGGVDDVQVDHNTAFPGSGDPSAFLVATGSETSARFIFTNNIMGVGIYGLIGQSTAPGQASLGAFFPGAVFTKNLLVGSLSGAGSYPSVTYNTATIDGVGFVNYAGGDYRLTTGSAYHNAGTDGKDLGVDLNALNAAAPGASSSTGVPAAPTNLKIQ